MNVTNKRCLAPAVSVLMPVYNAERYVVEAVESILSQTFQDYEFLIINDGSTDGSLAILERYAAQDERIRLISRENRGLVVTLNEGIDVARAPLIARMDADDISFPRRFEKQVAFLETHPECVALGVSVLAIDAEGAVLGEGLNAKYTSHEAIDGAHLQSVFGVICHPSVVMRREVLLSVQGYRPDYPVAEDVDLFLRLAEAGRLANLPDILLKYRQHLSSATKAHHAASQQSAHLALKDACRRRGLPAPPFPKITRAKNAAAYYGACARQALRAGNVATARKHAWRAFIRSPWSVASWRVLVGAMRAR